MRGPSYHLSAPGDRPRDRLRYTHADGGRVLSMSVMRTSVLTIALAAILAGCGSGAPGTPTMDPESVIATAEAVAQLTRSAVSPTSPPPRGTPTPTAPAVTLTATSAPSPAGPTASAAYNANVRSGPGVEFERIDDFYLGQSANLIGRHVNSLGELWWYIHRIGGGWDGWVWDGAVVITGDVSGVPFLEMPATPTPTG